MRKARVWRALMGLENTVVEDVVFDEDAGVLVVHARPTASRRGRCGACNRRSPGFDQGAGRRPWTVENESGRIHLSAPTSDAMEKAA